jgi:hypothetical protein
MDADALAMLITDNCKCQEQVHAIKRVAGNGNHYTQRYKILNLTPTVDSPTKGEVLATLSVSAGGIARPDGTFVHRSKGDPKYDEYVHIAKHNGRWLVAAIDFVGSQK